MKILRAAASSVARYAANWRALRAQTILEALPHGEIETNRRSWIRGAACAVLLLGFWLSVIPAALRAQVGTADVLGTVTDSTGALVAGATVTITNLGTAQTRTSTTTDKGEYVFTTLPNGSYSLRVESKGFKTFTIANFPLSTGDRARYDAALDPGTATEIVNVSEVASLQTDSSEVASTVRDTAIQEIPLNSRNFSSALQTQPGISMGTNSLSFAAGGSPEDRRPSFVIVANGLNDAWNDQLIDGFDNNERSLGLAGVRPSIDGIEEVKIATSSYSAEYGRAGGAVINIITKAGTNSLHGSAYEYFRNDLFDSRDFFAQVGSIPKPELRLNSFGGSVGGPVRIPKLYNGRNKTFFFADFEQDRLISGLAPYVLTVPTAYQETQFVKTGALDLSDANPSLAIIPAKNVNPIMANYFALFPSPNYTPPSGSSAGVGYFVSSPPEVQTDTNVDARIDEHFSPQDILFGRFAYNPVTTLVPEAIPETPSPYSSWSPLTSTTLKGIYPGGNGSGVGSGSFAGPSSTKSYNAQADYVHIFGSNLILDLKTGFTRIHIASLPFNDGTGAAQKVGFASDINTAGLLPAIGGPGLAWTPLLGSTNSVPLVDINNTYQYAGSFTYTHGSHNIKAGGSIIRRQVNAYTDALAPGFFLFWGQQGPPFAAANPYPDSRQNFIGGYPSLELRENAVVRPGFRAWEYAGYVQDDWRVNRSLTVNLGVRYDVYKPFTEAHGYFSNFLPTCLTSGTVGANCFATGSAAGGGGIVSPTVGVNTDYRDVAPRIGFALSLNSKTVVRGGFGMSYFPPDLGETSSGTGAPVSVLQNYNPPYSFDYAQPLPFGPNCNVTTSLGGTTGCIAQGPVAPSFTSLATFASNGNVTSVSAKPLNIRSSYVEMVNLTIERQLGTNNIVSVGYVGESGRGLLRTINLDQPLPPGVGNPEPPLVYAAQIPNVNTINYYYNGSSSSYNSMQLVYTRRLAQGLTANANYTWSHDLGIGTVGSLYAGPAGLDYGNVPNDLRHRVAVTADYELPFGSNFTGFQGFLVKGWKLNGVGYWQTGNPFTVYFPSNLNVPNLDSDRPNVIGSTKVHNAGIGEWFNTQAFAAQPLGVQGDERVGQLFGPHQRDVDLSIIKNFKIVESVNGQFRAECFNVSNTPNFALPDANSQDPTFGQILSTAPGTNARQWQFAMKFLF